MLLVPGVLAQVEVSPNPSFALGQPPEIAPTEPKSSSPNLVEGRELYNPQAAAVDPASGAIYVSDTLNNRVLGWRDARTFVSGSRADVVIGQRDRFSTAPGGPGTSLQSGLNQPTGLVVGAGSALYVADSGNNRILRYPNPFSQPDELKLADFVIGQSSFLTNTANFGGLSASSIFTRSGNNVYRTALAFDSQGNLWFTDPGNHRVLRYPASALASGATNGPSANLVLGQAGFQTNAPLSRTEAERLNKSGMRTPSGLAFDTQGRLFVADEMRRVVVYQPPFASGMAARRIMGIVVVAQGQQPPPPINEKSLGVILGNTWLPPEGVFTIGDVPFVLDTPANRIMRYLPYDVWGPEDPLNPSPAAQDVIGQDAMTSDTIIRNRGSNEPSQRSLAGPVAAAVAFNQVFVVDAGNNRVLQFFDLTVGSGASAAALRVLGQPGFANRSPNLIEGREFSFTGALGSGAGIAIDRGSNPPRLYVADPNNNRVLGFADARRVRGGDSADIFVGQLGGFRSLVNYPGNDVAAPTATGLFFPSAVTVDQDGNLFVADTGNGRVLRFPKPFAQQPGAVHVADLVIGQQNFNSKVTDATSRTMAAPSGLRFSIEGRLLVADSAHNRVLMFEPPYQNGVAASRVFGQPDFSSIGSGTPLTRMNGPVGISTDTSDRLYVCDASNNRVLIFSDIRLAPPANASAAVQIAGLRTPRDVYVSAATGRAWVAEAGRNRVLLYPQFDVLLLQGTTPLGEIPEGGPLAVEEDPFGNLFVADAFNRVVAHFRALTPTNSANFLTRVAPGMITTLWFTMNEPLENAGAAALPLPTELSDVQVLVNGKPMPLFFVGKAGQDLAQINMLMPNNAPSSGSVDVEVVRPSSLQILATNRVLMDVAAPGLFTATAMGTGQLAALNIEQDGRLTVNSQDNPVRVGASVAIFGTGAGHIPGAPPDGEAAPGAIPTPTKPRVFVNSRFLDDQDVLYSGLAPTLAGLWQINFRIPEFVPDGNIIVFVIMSDRSSTDPNRPGAIQTTIAVRR